MLFKKLFSNAFFLLIARVLFRAFNALVAIIIARYLGVEKFGIYSTALALVNTFLISNDIGSTTLLLREGSRDKQKINLFLGNSLIIQLCSSFVFFGLTLAVGWALSYDYLTMLLVIILGGATVIFEFRKSFRAVLRILLKLKFVAVIEVFTGGFIFLSVYLISKVLFDKDLGLILIAAVPLLFNFILILSLLIYNLKFVKPKYNLKKIWPMIKQGYIYSAYNIFYIVYFQVSILMVQAMNGNAEAGLYSAASKLIIVLLLVPQMIFQVVLPLMFKFSKTNLELYKRIHKIIFRYLNAFAIPTALGVWLLAEPFIDLVYNKNAFLPSAAALQIFAIFIFFRFLGNISGQSLTTQDKQKQKVIIQIISFIFLIILNYFFIKAYGFIGAAIATTITEGIIRISFMIMDFKYLKQSGLKYLKNLIVPFIAAGIMGGFIYFTEAYLNVIVLVIFGALIYGLFLWLLRFFKVYEIKLFKQLIPNKK